MTKRALAVSALVLGLLALAAAPPVSAQCAMCKTALTGSPEGRHMAHQLNFAILMMVAAPYVIAGAVASVLFRRQIGARLAPWRKRLSPAQWRWPRRRRAQLAG
jgi:ABC-type phosphate transport system permease subunit